MAVLLFAIYFVAALAARSGKGGFPFQDRRASQNDCGDFPGRSVSTLSGPPLDEVWPRFSGASRNSRVQESKMERFNMFIEAGIAWIREPPFVCYRMLRNVTEHSLGAKAAWQGVKITDVMPGFRVKAVGKVEVEKKDTYQASKVQSKI